MQNSLKVFALIFSIILTSCTFASKWIESLNDEVLTNEELLFELESACRDASKLIISPPEDREDGIYRRLGITIASVDNDEGSYLDCQVFNIGPIKDTELTNIFKDNQIQEDPVCREQLYNEKLADTLKITTALGHDLDAILCEENKSNSSREWSGDIFCNFARSFRLSNLKELVGDSKCSESGDSNCLNAMFRGLVDKLYLDGKLIMDLSKLGYNFLKEKASNGFGVIKSWFTSREVQDAEDETSQGLHMAAQMDDKELEKKRRSFKQWVEDVWKEVKNFYITKYACGKWDGAPHFSTCLEPTKEWSCASFDAKTDMWCAVGGAFIAEIPEALLLGGTFRAASYIPGLSKGLKNTGNSIVKTGKTVGKIPGAKFVGKTLILPLYAFNALGKLPVIKQYFYYSEKAFMTGLKGPTHMKTYFASSSYVTAQSKLTKAEEVFLKKSQNGKNPTNKMNQYNDAYAEYRVNELKFRRAEVIKSGGAKTDLEELVMNVKVPKDSGSLSLARKTPFVKTSPNGKIDPLKFEESYFGEELAIINGLKSSDNISSELKNASQAFSKNYTGKSKKYLDFEGIGYDLVKTDNSSKLVINPSKSTNLLNSGVPVNHPIHQIAKELSDLSGGKVKLTIDPTKTLSKQLESKILTSASGEIPLSPLLISSPETLQDIVSQLKNRKAKLVANPMKEKAAWKEYNRSLKNLNNKEKKFIKRNRKIGEDEISNVQIDKALGSAIQRYQNAKRNLSHSLSKGADDSYLKSTNLEILISEVQGTINKTQNFNTPLVSKSYDEFTRLLKQKDTDISNSSYSAYEKTYLDEAEKYIKYAWPDREVVRKGSEISLLPRKSGQTPLDHLVNGFHKDGLELVINPQESLKILKSKGSSATTSGLIEANGKVYINPNFFKNEENIYREGLSSRIRAQKNLKGEQSSKVIVPDTVLKKQVNEKMLIRGGEADLGRSLSKVDDDLDRLREKSLRDSVKLLKRIKKISLRS